MTVHLIQAGFGGWGRGWQNNILQGGLDVNLVAGVDINPEALQVARERNIPCFNRLEEALEAVEADAVLVATSLTGHVPLIQTALEYGKHVLVEKPFAPSLEEAQRMVDLAHTRSRVLMVSQNYRHSPVVQVVTEMVHSSTMGKVDTVNIDFRRPLHNENKNHAIWQPLLANLSVHHFDLIRKVLGQEPLRIDCYAWNPPWSNYSDPASARAIIQLSGGTLVSYRGSCVSMGPATPWAGEWRMECEGGEIAWSSGEGDHVTVTPFKQESYNVPLPKLPYTGRLSCLNAFLQAIHSGQEPETSGRDNLHTLAMVMAAVASASSGKSQMLEPLP